AGRMRARHTVLHAPGMGTAMNDAMMAEIISITGHGGEWLGGYLARPPGPGPDGSVVVIHHIAGDGAQANGITATCAAHGSVATCANLPSRRAPGAGPDEAAAASRAQGGVPDDRLVGDVAGAVAHLRAMPAANGKAATIGYCSGGRQSFLAACSMPPGAAGDCYGAFVLASPPAGLPAQR